MPLLADYRILELADESGAWCGRVLAELSADVVKIEPPGGERSRFYPPFAAHAPAPEASLYFAGRNLNKRSLVLDLGSADDRETFHQLVAAADALIAGGPPGTVDSEALHAVNPRLVVTAFTPYGIDGPYRDRPGTALTAFALSGPLWRSGFAHRPPVTPPADLAYAIAGITAATATFIGLLVARRTGRGCTIDSSMVEAVSATSDWSVPAFSTTRFMLNRAGHGLAYPIYPCSDGYVCIVAFTTNQWRTLRRWLGEPEALQAPEWDSLLYRITNAPAIDVFTAELCAGRTMRELYDEGIRRGCLVAPVYTVVDALDDAQMASRGSFTRVHHPAIGPMTLPASAVRLASEPPASCWGYRRRRSQHCGAIACCTERVSTADGDFATSATATEASGRRARWAVARGRTARGRAAASRRAQGRDSLPARAWRIDALPPDSRHPAAENAVRSGKRSRRPSHPRPARQARADRRAGKS